MVGCDSIGVRASNPIFPTKNKVNDNYTNNYNPSDRYAPVDNSSYLAEAAKATSPEVNKLITQKQIVPDNFGSARTSKSKPAATNHNNALSSSKTSTSAGWFGSKNKENPVQKRELASFAQEIDRRYQTKSIPPAEPIASFSGEGTDLTKIITPSKGGLAKDSYVQVSYSYSEALDAEFEKISPKPSFPPEANFASNGKQVIHPTSSAMQVKHKAAKPEIVVVDSSSKSTSTTKPPKKKAHTKQASHSSPSTGAPKGSRLRHPLTTGPNTGRHSVTPSPFANTHREEFSYYEALGKLIEITSAPVAKINPFFGTTIPAWHVSYRHPLSDYLKGTSNF